MIKREQVLQFLRLKQGSEGGFFGKDLTDLAELLGVTPRGLRWRRTNWIKTDKEFSQFIYLGKEKPSVTLSEFFKIEQELGTNPIKVKKGIYEDIQEERKAQNQKPLAESTFYRYENNKFFRCTVQKHTTGSKLKKFLFLKTARLRKIVNLSRPYSLFQT